jgi:hypothetical protein
MNINRERKKQNRVDVVDPFEEKNHRDKMMAQEREVLLLQDIKGQPYQLKNQKPLMATGQMIKKLEDVKQGGKEPSKNVFTRLT